LIQRFREPRQLEREQKHSPYSSLHALWTHSRRSKSLMMPNINHLSRTRHSSIFHDRRSIFNVLPPWPRSNHSINQPIALLHFHSIVTLSENRSDARKIQNREKLTLQWQQSRSSRLARSLTAAEIPPLK